MYRSEFANEASTYALDATGTARQALGNVLANGGMKWGAGARIESPAITAGEKRLKSGAQPMKRQYRPVFRATSERPSSKPRRHVPKSCERMA